MPQIGDVSIQRKNCCTWHACVDCGKERWVRLRQPCLRCRVCSMKLHRCSQKIARLGVRTSDGYIRIHKSLVDPFFHPMALKTGQIVEHRLVIAKQIGRCLHPWEVVHHKNGIKDDNRYENLQLISEGKHQQFTIMQNRIDHLQNKVRELETKLTKS